VVACGRNAKLLCIARLAQLPFILPCVANLCFDGSAHFTCKLVSVPNLFWRGRRKNLDAVNRLDDLFQGTFSVHGLRFNRLVQPAKRVMKRRAIRPLLGDLASKLPDFCTSHSRHVVRSLADECQPDEAEGSQGVLSGVQERAGDRVDAPALVSCPSSGFSGQRAG
jgi:hypothetical protein